MKTSLKKNQNKKQELFTTSLELFSCEVCHIATSSSFFMEKKKKNYGGGVINKS